MVNFFFKREAERYLSAEAVGYNDLLRVRRLLLDLLESVFKKFIHVKVEVTWTGSPFRRRKCKYVPDKKTPKIPQFLVRQPFHPLENCRFLRVQRFAVIDGVEVYVRRYRELSPD